MEYHGIYGKIKLTATRENIGIVFQPVGMGSFDSDLMGIPSSTHVAERSEVGYLMGNSDDHCDCSSLTATRWYEYAG